MSPIFFIDFFKLIFKIYKSPGLHPYLFLDDENNQCFVFTLGARNVTLLLCQEIFIL